MLSSRSVAYIQGFQAVLDHSPPVSVLARFDQWPMFRRIVAISQLQDVPKDDMILQHRGIAHLVGLAA